MKKKILLLLSLFALNIASANEGGGTPGPTGYNGGKFDNFREVNLTKVKYNRVEANNVVGKEGNTGLWDGIGPNGEAAGTATLHYTRIPAMIITNDNKLVVMYDLRWHPHQHNGENIGSDHARIDQGISISEDGGITWKNKTAIKFDDAWTYGGVNRAPQPNRRRLMDPTLLYNHLTDDIYSIHGSWNEFSRKGGNGNWFSSRNVYYDELMWAALIHKSVDGGENWTRTHKFDRLNNDVFKNHSIDNPVKGFLGGVGTGIVMRDGTLVLPIQTAHEAGQGRKSIGATLMYSRDNGKTWIMPEVNNSKILQPNGSSIENMIFEMGDKLVITGRGNDGNSTNHRWAYYTTDMGNSWHKFEPLNAFQPVNNQATQGSTLYVTLPSGKKVILVSAPNGNNGDRWQRGNMALWALSGKDKTQKKEITIYRPGSGNRFGAGYSSLAYKGGNLFVAYEDAGDISVKNLTEFIPTIEAAATEWGLEDERAKDIEKVRALENLSEAQKEALIAAMMEDNDRGFTEAMVLNNEFKELDDDIAKYAEELKNNPEVLASNIRKFNLSLEGVQGEERDKIIKVLALRVLKGNIDEKAAKFKEVIDFSSYRNLPQRFLYNRRDIVDHDSRVFAGFGKKLGLLHNHINENDFRVGYNHSLDNMKFGGFAEGVYSKNNAHNLAFGGMFKITLEDKYTFRNFARYRYQNLINVSKGGENADDETDASRSIPRHNIDIYSSVEAKYQVHKDIKLTPKAGLLLTYSHDTLLDEDVRLDRKVSASADFSLKAEAKVGNINFKVKPEILVSDNTQYISQSNLWEKKEKIDGKIFEYNMQFGINTEHSGMRVDFDINLNDISRDNTNYELNLNAGYTW